MKDHEFRQINSMKAVHTNGMVLELFFIKIKLTKGDRFCEVPIESYPVGSDEKTGTKKWAADVFLSALGPWQVGEEVVPMSKDESSEVSEIIKGVMDFWRMPHEMK